MVSIRIRSLPPRLPFAWFLPVFNGHFIHLVPSWVLPGYCLFMIDASTITNPRSDFRLPFTWILPAFIGCFLFTWFTPESDLFFAWFCLMLRLVFSPGFSSCRSRWGRRNEYNRIPGESTRSPEIHLINNWFLPGFYLNFAWSNVVGQLLVFFVTIVDIGQLVNLS